ncbi:hypothetical protein, partial [Bacillus thuringiensis]|uniref:hypothetical protein n=1 Tax=Bacillus thuringiensis TaxID=1428 RepID=UPI0021759CB8
SDRATGIETNYHKGGRRPVGKELDLTAREADLKLKLGKIIMPYYVKGLEMSLSALTKINAFVTAHPTFTKIAVGAIGLVAVAVIVGGSMTVLTAGIRGLLILRNIGPVFRMVGAGFNILRGALTYLPQLLRVVGAAMGPVGLAVAAIATVGLLVWNNWKEIKAAFFTICKDIYGGFVKLFHGDILG